MPCKLASTSARSAPAAAGIITASSQSSMAIAWSMWPMRRKRSRSLSYDMVVHASGFPGSLRAMQADPATLTKHAVGLSVALGFCVWICVHAASAGGAPASAQAPPLTVTGLESLLGQILGNKMDDEQTAQLANRIRKWVQWDHGAGSGVRT